MSANRTLSAVTRLLVALSPLVCACHADIRPSTNRESEEGPNLRSRETQLASKLSLHIDQVASPSAVRLRIVLTNLTTQEDFWVNSRPSIGDLSELPRRRAEIELHLVDSLMREIRGTCADLSVGPRPENFKGLSPGQSLQIAYNVDPNCYLLTPGETLWLQASYLATDDGPEPEAGAVVLKEPVSTTGWQKLVVPAGWTGLHWSPPQELDEATSATSTSARPEPGLSLWLDQAPSPSAVKVKMILTNSTSDRRFWVNSKPRVGLDSIKHRAEMGIVLVDKNLRNVRSLCPEDGDRRQANFEILYPGQSLEIKYSFDPNCYMLVPGEGLWMSATYYRQDSWPAPPPETEHFYKPIWSGRHSIVVPSTWKSLVAPTEPPPVQ